MLDCTQYVLETPKSFEMAKTINTIKRCDIIALFGIFLEANENQNLIRLIRHPIVRREAHKKPEGCDSEEKQ